MDLSIVATSLVQPTSLVLRWPDYRGSTVILMLSSCPVPQSGAVFYLGLFLFQYDYTLDESGVEASEETNQQEVINQLARYSIKALGRLGGLLGEFEHSGERTQLSSSVDCTFLDHTFCMADVSLTCEITQVQNVGRVCVRERETFRQMPYMTENRSSVGLSFQESLFL